MGNGDAAYGNSPGFIDKSLSPMAKPRPAMAPVRKNDLRSNDFFMIIDIEWIAKITKRTLSKFLNVFNIAYIYHTKYVHN